ncbi:MAG: hypothetical protein KDH89_02260 [Anaerolineae bacterium]|nr:hypothetical protein [Anaerolineae bacterium]
MNAAKLKNPSFSLIQTKLYRPAVSDNLIRRPRLTNLLNNGRNLPLTLVLAPAGSGKTTLLSDWLDTCPCPSAWLSLDESDSDLDVFLSYFIAAIRTIFPEACEQTLALLQVAELPPTKVLAGTLINEIEGLHNHPLLADEQRFVLVLDDYQLISGQEVNELLIDLLRHPSQTMSLAISTRRDPALPLNKLRAGGLLTEIRRQDLRFSAKETKEYLQRSTEHPVSDSVAAVLTDKTEGWITGLHLAVLNLRHISDSDEFVASFEASERYIMDYLVDEVLSRQSAAVEEFLLKTSVLNRLCGPLCEAVINLDTPVCNGQAYLEWLEQTDLFIVALDNQQQWFRYHHLFQLLLQTRLERQYSRDEIAEIHRKASLWYAENGFVEDAIIHAMAAGDEQAAVRVVVTHRHEAMNQERWLQIDRWLRLIPSHLIDEQPALLLLKAFVLQRQWRFPDIPPYLDSIDSRIEALGPGPETGQLRGEVDALRSMLSFYSLRSGKETSALASRALERLPMAHSSVRGLAWLYYAAGFQATGETTRARELFLEGLKEDSLHGNSFPSRILFGLCFLTWMNTDLASLRQVATHYLRLSTERGLTEGVGFAHYFLGTAAYDANDLERAESEFKAVTVQRYIAHAAPYSQCAFGLASLYLARGDIKQAGEVIDLVETYSIEINNSRILAETNLFRALLALKQGQYAEARHRTAAFDDITQSVPAVMLLNQEVVLASILLNLATPADLRKAAAVILRLRDLVERASNTRRMIDLLALQALLADAQGNRAAALLSLGQAVDLAEPSSVLRAFVDLGSKIASLLAELGRQRSNSGFIGQILQAFPPADTQGIDLIHTVPEVANQANLIEPLTNREMEVLEMLAQRLTAKEIAGDLFISERTVKRHTANIYQKLGVHSRQQAVASATYLGILDNTTP